MEGTDGQAEGKFSLADAKHVGFDEFVKAAVESLLKGFQLASFGCTKCGATHLDSGYFACK